MSSYKVTEIQFDKPTSFPGSPNPRKEMHLKALRAGSTMDYVPAMLAVRVSIALPGDARVTDWYPTNGLVRFRFAEEPVIKEPTKTDTKAAEKTAKQ